MLGDDQGSQPRCAHVSAYLWDRGCGADITIIGGVMFKNRNIWPAERMLCSYDYKPLKLNGRMYWRYVSFGGKTVTTPVYIKMDAKDPLLLFEGVCR